jgi:hypothetical protein
MAKKEPIYRGLAELPVQVEDKSVNSPDYFRITKIPTEFTAGVNTIKFKGNPSLFANESQIDIEVLDSNGLPIYYETGLDLESASQNAIINVFINQDTAPGIGTIYICGTISKDVSGKKLTSNGLNLRWSTPISIDISKRNNVDILYTALPTVTISSTSGAYTNLGFPGGNRIVSNSYSLASGQLNYLNYNSEPLLATGSNATFAFTSSAISSTVIITSANLTNVNPALPSNLGVLTASSSIKNYSGSGIAYLLDPIVFNNPNGIENYIVKSATVTGLTYIVEQSASLTSATTENSFNTAVVYFNNLAPDSGQVAKIRSYYKSTGVGEYIFSNETDITSFAAEEGFTPSTFTASFAIPTTHRNDRLDFKFEFVNPAGLVSKQVLESKNHLFLGGNTYVGGDDNLLTGSLYVAGSTGTGVHISGKGSAAMIRSIGYTGFRNATSGSAPGGFVMYSGSIQPLLNAAEQYAGVGLELVANSSSYFKYTTSGSGLLDIRTGTFFLGNDRQYISGSNGLLQISSSNFFLSSSGNLIIAGNITATGGSIGGFTITSHSLAGSNFFMSGAAQPTQFFISASSFNVKGNGAVTASGLQIISAETNTKGYVIYDSGRGFLDAYNIAKPVYSMPHIVRFRHTLDNAPTSVTGSITTFEDSKPQLTGSFYLLPGETACYFIATTRVFRSATVVGDQASLNLRLSIYTEPAGLNTSIASGSASTGSLIATAQLGITTAGPTAKGTAGKNSFKSAVIDLSTYSSKLFRWKIEQSWFAIVDENSPGNTFTFEYGNINILTSRDFQTAFDTGSAD